MSTFMIQHHNEEERSLIKEYAVQVKDMQKNQRISKVYLLSGEVWKPGYCSCHDYGKGGDRRGEERGTGVCKTNLIDFCFFITWVGV